MWDASAFRKPLKYITKPCSGPGAWCETWGLPLTLGIGVAELTPCAQAAFGSLQCLMPRVQPGPACASDQCKRTEQLSLTQDNLPSLTQPLHTQHVTIQKNSNPVWQAGWATRSASSPAPAAREPPQQRLRCCSWHPVHSCRWTPGACTLLACKSEPVLTNLGVCKSMTVWPHDQPYSDPSRPHCLTLCQPTSGMLSDWPLSQFSSLIHLQKHISLYALVRVAVFQQL